MPAGGTEPLQAEEDAARLNAGYQGIGQRNEVKLIRLGMQVALNGRGGGAVTASSVQVRPP